ncbi:LytTR family DNA-binding domain-containing protein [Paraflavitalea sp. CAU 1676]|uniref:LytR/AlgR family response regulator transcription factor n=1 Tax=Paraflavitalea sp. CAU 1676 TaxID=3032598 RepID=UPI0023DA45D8|nr:LytTR family DNA-binding domain-containing protein [Paraflavitalea sp. CAU 1676]MDF2193535.1 LytTR family DNA-binding domain-containing protein [Paraflavitalea sp. CAU 1676]
MQTLPIKSIAPVAALNLLPAAANEIAGFPGNLPEELKAVYQYLGMPWLDSLLKKLTVPAGKKSFLVFRNNKYINVPTENIALFYIKYESVMIMTFDKQKYFLDHSLEQVQQLLPEGLFYRLNRQYLINFNAVKEVEYYLGRKLLVNIIVPMKDKLLVSKEKVSEFLHWLDNR